MSESESRINCSLFKRTQDRIRGSFKEIDKLNDPQEKLARLKKIIKAVEPLLNCLEYDGESHACKNCRTVAISQKSTAQLIIDKEQGDGGLHG